MILNNSLTRRDGTFFAGKVAGKLDFLYRFGLKGFLSMILALTCSLSSLCAIQPDALPTGYSSGAGNVQFTQNGSTLTVSSGSNASIANYGTFNVGSNAAVNFNLPGASSVILNRVTGSTGSEIFGQINSNGRVFLVNPNGVLFGATSQVNVGSLVVSTLGITDKDFLDSNYTFAQSGAPAAIINMGSIKTAPGGLTALIAGAIRNDGTITTNAGGTRLAVGDKVTLNFGDGVTANLTIDQALKSKVEGFKDGIVNNGSIIADGGSIKANAYLENSMYDTLVNNKGLMQANELVVKDGYIEITRHGEIELAGFTKDCTGTVANSGNLIASDANGGRDGLVQVLGDKLDLTGGGIVSDTTSLFSDASFNIGTSVNTNNLRLRSVEGGITQSAPILNAERTSIIAKGNVDLTNPLNDMWDVAANITGPGSHINIVDRNDMRVNDLDGLNGIVTNNGDITLNVKGDLRLDEIVSAGSGNVYLTAGKSIKQDSMMVSGKNVDLKAGNSIKGNNWLNDYFLIDAKNVTSNVDVKSVTVDQIKSGFDLGTFTGTKQVKVGEYTVPVDPPPTATTGGTPLSPTVAVSDGAFLDYLQSLVKNAAQNGSTSGSQSGSSANINDALFRQIANDFKNNIQQNNSGNEVQANGNFQYSFKIPDGRTVKVSGSFAEFQKFADSASGSGSGTKTVPIYENQPYTINYNNRVASEIKNVDSRKGEGVGVRNDWNSITCPDCKPRFENGATEISNNFDRSETRDLTPQVDKSNDYNNKYDLNWEILPADQPTTTTTVTPTGSPDKTPVVVSSPVGIPTNIPVFNQPIVTSTPTLIPASAVVISELPTNTVALPSSPLASVLFYKEAPVAEAPAAAPVVGSTPIAETPAEEAPVEESPAMAQPVFYYPGLW
jgi:filamentous hemagglutinin family protein